MGKFYGKLKTEYINGRIWKIINPDCQFYYIPDGGQAIIPRDGEVTDFASVPRIFWRIFPPTGDGDTGDWGEPAIIHDTLYKRHDGYSRKMADDIFLEAMKDEGVSIWKRKPIYWAVRLFGYFPWKK